jgi:hypothetical protein
MLDYLNQKTEVYVRYAENALKKKCMLTDSPAPK